MRLLPRISTTVSFGSNTSVICSASSMSRIRAWRLSTTLFSCPEYVWIKYHCFIVNYLKTRQFVDHPGQAVKEIDPRPIDNKKVQGKENNADDDDDHRVPDIFRRREARSFQFFAGVSDKIADAFLFLVAFEAFDCCLCHVFNLLSVNRMADSQIIRPPVGGRTGHLRPFLPMA